MQTSKYTHKMQCELESQLTQHPNIVGVSFKWLQEKHQPKSLVILPLILHNLINRIWRWSLLSAEISKTVVMLLWVAWLVSNNGNLGSRPGLPSLLAIQIVTVSGGAVH